MKSRRKGREQALQILFQLELNEELTSIQGLEAFETNFSQDHEAGEFTRRLVLGVVNNKAVIDEKLKGSSEHWKLGRMPTVDRNLLRLGVFELEFCDDIPATVTINEMVELAKQFGAENSAGFINGVLDKIAGQLDRPTKTD